jgi:hypothetical protein
MTRLSIGKIIVFWDVTVCSYIENHCLHPVTASNLPWWGYFMQHLQMWIPLNQANQAEIFLSSWRWRQQVSPKCWHLFLWHHISEDHNHDIYSCENLTSFISGVLLCVIAWHLFVLIWWMALYGNIAYYSYFCSLWDVVMLPKCWQYLGSHLRRQYSS